MTIALVCAAIKNVTSGLTSVTSETVPTTLTVTAYDPPPLPMPNLVFPAVYTLTGGAQDETNADEDVETREYEVHCAIGPTTQTTLTIREYYIRALIPALKARLMKYEGFGVAGVLDVRITGDSGNTVLPEHDGVYVGFIIDLTITELISRTYAASE